MQRKPRKSNQLKAEERNISAYAEKTKSAPKSKKIERNISAHAEKTATISVF